MTAARKGLELVRVFRAQLVDEQAFVAAVEEHHYGRMLAAKVRLKSGQQRIARLVREFLKEIA